MTWVDAAAISIIILSAIFSLVRGFVREMLGVAAWIGAAFAALKGYQFVLPYVSSVISAHNMQTPVSIGVVFLVILIILSIISAWLGGIVRESALSGLDRSLGLVFGVVRGAFILCLAYIGMSLFVAPSEWPTPVVNARVLPFAYQGATALVGLLPTGYQPAILPLPVAGAPPAKTLMQQPVSGTALRTE
jgi:membrane protein required for colicin V production